MSRVPFHITQHLIYGLLPLRLIADISDGLDDGFIGDVAFDGGGASGEVDSHFIDALQTLQGLFHIGTAVVAHHAVHFKHSCFHSFIFFLWYKSHDQCINKQTSQHDTTNHVEQGWRGMAAGVSQHQMRGKPLTRQQIIHTQAEGKGTQVIDSR